LELASIRTTVSGARASKALHSGPVRPHEKDKGWVLPQDSEAESEAETESEAEAVQPQGPQIIWRTRAEEFIRRVTLRLVLQIGWQNRLPNEATRMVAGYLLG